MKKILGLGLIFLTILMTGCSSDDSNNENNSISATINDVKWKPIKINSVTLIKVPGEGQRFDISIQDNSQMLSLAFESELTTNDAMPLRVYNFYEEEVSDALFLNTY